MIETITDTGRLLEIQPQWETLLARSSDASPYLTPAWVSCWWRHFGAGDRIAALAAWNGDQLQALAPMMVTRRRLKGALIRLVIGVGAENADYSGVLLGDSPDDVVVQPIDSIAALSDRGSSLPVLGRLRPGGDTTSALDRWIAGQGRFRRHPLSHEEYPWRNLEHLAADPSKLQRLLKRNDVPRRLRRLREEGDVAFRYHVAGKAEADPAVFLRLHDLRWRTRAGQPSGLFVSSRGRTFLTDFATTLDGEGSLRISFVTLDDEPVAARFGVELEGTYYGMKSAFDPRFASYGPGHLIVGLVIEQLAALGVRRFEFMRGAGDHKAAWAEGVETVEMEVLAHAGVRGSLDVALSRLALRGRYRSRFA